MREKTTRILTRHPTITGAVLVPLIRRDGLCVGNAVVDASDVPLVAQYTWTRHAGGAGAAYTPYARRSIDSGRKRLMHRDILGVTDPRILVDHVNGNGLDNRRENLRIVTHSQNQQNRTRVRGVSRYRGVVWNANRTRWQVIHQVDGQRHYLGLFDDEDEAGAAAAAWRREHMPYATEAP